MRTVIERLGHSIDDGGVIHYDERPSTYEAAEAIIGRRLDRRRNYCIMQGDEGEGLGVFETISWSQKCSGCDGGGCHECGYQGVVRQGHWVPVGMCDAGRSVLKEPNHAG